MIILTKRLAEMMGTGATGGWHYRYGEWSAPDDVSAADVIRFEQDYLGNAHLGISPEVIAELERRPSRDLIWVCRSKGEARQFVPEGICDTKADLQTVYITANCRVLAEDGDGGLLLLLPESGGA